MNPGYDYACMTGNAKAEMCTDEYIKRKRRQAYNPYLPGWEYIPDGEPHKFDGRIYLYGSHDRAGGNDFCLNDYVAWSAPENALWDWRYEGVIYRRSQHPDTKHNLLFAPDVAQGPDGRYYLYYSAAGTGVMSVAVCDQPAGQYAYLGDVKTSEGHVYGESPADWFHFDPSVLVDDDGRIWLYSGAGWAGDDTSGHPVVGCFVTELAQDMLTMKSDPKLLLPADNRLDVPNFYEGSSVRHIGDLYYLVYPATDLTGLNYRTSRYPDRDFVYRGCIHSTSDVGYQGRPAIRPNYPLGNNHGGLVEACGQWYIFDHRMTNNTLFSRQGVAEPITIAEDGTIEMVESTSCGLNGGPLEGIGAYPAYIACVLTNNQTLDLSALTHQAETADESPMDAFNALYIGLCVSQDEPDYDPDNPIGQPPMPYIKRITDGCTVGYKYFSFDRIRKLTVELRGDAVGTLLVHTVKDGPEVGAIPVDARSDTWTAFSADVALHGEKIALYLTYQGTGSFDLRSIQFEA